MKKNIIGSIFDAIKLNPIEASKKAYNWFLDKIKELRKDPNLDISKVGLLKSTTKQQSNRLLPGSMVFFSYDPKYKETLPYYDKFPLAFVFQIDKTGFTGINFHYLSYPMRIKLYDKMWQIARTSNMPSQQVMALTWQLLGNVSKFPEVQPAVKRYLFNHVQSRFIKVNLDDWKTAIMLDNAQFVKVSAESVHKISTRLAYQSR